uniref:4Fe-4S single cluster domain protein n=1 Tax=Siphoviridae sp. ctiOl67 TaxID=2825622 RepID=A0A8S5QJ01_9CAUD|nr:MAG TPA: 4Fe-4S single cluster domain protein [Siphoviridae sp. ctiOl67]
MRAIFNLYSLDEWRRNFKCDYCSTVKQELW